MRGTVFIFFITKTVGAFFLNANIPRHTKGDKAATLSKSRSYQPTVFFAQQEMEAVLLITCLITHRDHRQKITRCRQANLKPGSPPKHKVVSSGGPFCVFVSVNKDKAFLNPMLSSFFNYQLLYNLTHCKPQQAFLLEPLVSDLSPTQTSFWGPVSKLSVTAYCSGG